MFAYRFQAGGVFGWLGYGFSDFNGQTFLVYAFWIWFYWQTAYMFTNALFRPKQKEQTMVEFAESELPGEPSPKKAKTIDEAVTIEDEADQQVKVVSYHSHLLLTLEKLTASSFPELRGGAERQLGCEEVPAQGEARGAAVVLSAQRFVYIPTFMYKRCDVALLKITDKQDDFDEGAFLAAWKEELEKAFMKEQAESLDAGDAI